MVTALGSRLALEERTVKRQVATYRVYFTVEPTTYYTVNASTASVAVGLAEGAQRALRLCKRQTAALKVARIERLDFADSPSGR